MKRSIDTVILAVLTIVMISCNSTKKISKENAVEEIGEKTFAVVDYVNKIVFINSRNIEEIRLNELKILLKKQKLELESPLFKNGDTLYTKNGEKLMLKLYSKNLVKDNLSSSSKDYWKYYGENSIKRENNNFIYTLNGRSGDIGQTIDLEGVDYREKYLVFICNAKAKNFVHNSITGKPYLWGHQFGDFKENDWPYMADNVNFSDNENKWEVIYGINQLLEGVKSVYVRMSLGLRKDESRAGAKATITDMNVRVFNSKEDAQYYVDNIFKRK